MNLVEALLLAVIEGITEYLPISSTGHMILASSMMGIAADPFVKLFTVAIQLGAILAVVVLYFRRFFRSVNFYFKLFVAFLPSAFFGILLSDTIDALLESPLGVALSLLLGGIILLFVDKWFDRAALDDSDQVDWLQALKIGFFQCIAMIPGVSRSGATIVGGMANGLSRKAAAEFSFFLAVPTMAAATLKKCYDYYQLGFELSSEQVNLLLIGNAVAFVVAMLAIRFFIDFLTKQGFRLFGIYRIALGILILAMLLSGKSLSIV
jgi:undecaprenyl-diphosphatase